MHLDLMFPSEFLRASDLNGKEVTVEIESVKLDDLTMVGGTKKKKGVIRFKGAKKAFVLNKTNAVAIAKVHGKETDSWAGKKITVYPTTTRFGAETVDCIRVK